VPLFQNGLAGENSDFFTDFYNRMESGVHNSL
jgi:hypothetical protein